MLSFSVRHCYEQSYDALTTIYIKMLLGAGDQVMTAFYTSKTVKFYERNTALNSTLSLISFSRVFLAILE